MESQINSLETRIEKMQERFNKDLEASEVRGDSGEELPHTPTPPHPRPGAAAERSYPSPRPGAVAGRSYPMSEVRGDG